MILYSRAFESADTFVWISRGLAGNRLSVYFVFRPAPPLGGFTLYNWDIRQSRMLVKANWNSQSRGSPESLRPSEACAPGAGITRKGEFRAAPRTTPTPMLTVTVRLKCEIYRGSAFINIAGPVSGEWLLFSTRQSRRWRQFAPRLHLATLVAAFYRLFFTTPRFYFGYRDTVAFRHV